jgi:dephospho-CoA kinase
LRIIGVTGGIGSGKSTVSGILESFGAKIIDADAIARNITRNKKVLAELASAFGREIINPEGKLDRKKLAEIAFNDAAKLKKLNQITHKHVAAKIVKEVEKIKKENKYRIVVLDVPIPVNHGFLDIVDEVWVVVADRNARIERVMKRSGLTREEVEKRIDSQMRDSEYIRLANIIIENNCEIEELHKKIEGLLNRF